jgi:uncharacterized protein (DUF305 family)
MANAERKKGRDPKLKTLAQTITTAQQREIAEMRKHLDGRDGADMNRSTEEHDAEHPG